MSVFCKHRRKQMRYAIHNMMIGAGTLFALAVWINYPAHGEHSWNQMNVLGLEVLDESVYGDLYMIDDSGFEQEIASVPIPKRKPDLGYDAQFRMEMTQLIKKYSK